jgi:carbon-monoxide dehydrogenase large subunit
MTSFGIGRSVRRIEDARFLRGRGRFVDDIHLPHQSFGVVLMSPHAHARIKSVDATEAKAANGVICVLTGGDLIADKLGCLPPLFMPEDYGGPKGYRTCRPLLVTEHVRCVGDRVAFVVAETLAQAQTAAELIHVHYEPLPAVIGLESAIQENAPRIWQDCPTGNVSFELTFGDQRATDAAFAAAKHVVSLRLRNNRVSANPLEPRAAIGCYEPASDSYTLYTTTQNPHGVRSLVAGTVLKIPESKLRVVGPDVGGGFGLKTNPHVEDALVLWASRRCGRPVKWVATRSDSLVGDYQARDQIVDGEMALDQDGRILGIRARALHALGAYTAAVCAVPISCAMQFIPNVYDVKAVDLRTRAVFTNTAAVTAYRGTGRPEANYLVERLIDEAAIKIGLDPAEIRRRNLITPSAMPYMTATGITYDSGEFALVLDKCLKIVDWAGFSKRRSASEKKGQLRGRSVTCYIETAGYANERMEIRFDPDGAVTIVAGTHSHGQGHATTYAQMVAEWLGVSFETIRFIQGDTDKVPFRPRHLRGAQFHERRQRTEGRRRRDHCQGPADGRSHARGRPSRHRLSSGAIPGSRNRPHASACGGRSIVFPGRRRHRPVRPWARGQRQLWDERRELSQRLPCLRNRNRSGDGIGQHRAIHGGGRRWAGDKSADLRGSSSWRPRAGHRAGNAGANRI